MNRYADPRRCPDCLGPIENGAPSCPTCGLALTGQTAQRLFTTLATADDLLATLRAVSVAAAPASHPAPASVAPFDPAPFPVQRRVGAPARGLSAPSVPRILLGLGALCLLVAALVFLAVTWSVLGVGGRTATLVGLTAIAAGLTGWLSHRGLRAAAESLALVGYGLLTLDVFGANHAGWFGDLSSAGFTTLLGVTLAATGVAGTLLVRRRQSAGLVGAEVVAALGCGLVALSLGTAEWFPPSWSLVLATAVSAAFALAARALRLTVAAVGAGAVTVLAWLGLTGLGVDRAVEATSWHALVADGRVWPLLAAAAFAAAPAVVRTVPTSVRVGAASVSLLLALTAVLAPAHLLDPTAQVLVALAVLVAMGAATVSLPHPWQLSASLTQLVAGLGTLAAVGLLAVTALGRLGDAATDSWSGNAADLLPPSPADLPAAWLLPLGVVALLGTAWVLTRSLTVAVPGAGPVAETTTGLLAAATVAAIACYPVPVWLPVALLLLVAAGYVGWWLLQPTAGTVVGAAGFAAAADLVALHAESLTESALAVTLVLALVVHLRSRHAELAAVAGAVGAVALGGVVWTAGALADVDAPRVALTALLVLGAAAVLAPYLPDRLWSAEPRVAQAGLEVGAAMVALPLATAGVLTAPVGQQASWLAAYLTVAGVAVTGTALLRSDRRMLSWPGGFLLALASWVRLWDLGVRAPEAYTLPSAAVLLAVGLLHLHRNREASTMTALGPALSLALVPSLLWTLTEPPGLRALLLGLGCLLLVLVGVRLGWTAPVALGATVGAVLVLRLAAPYIGSTVPRWVLIGGAGAVLLVVGATWERRLQEARHLTDYVRGLR